MSLLKSAFTVSALTLVSRLFGYVRDIFIASILGAGILADTFLVAYRLPNFFRQISAEGAVNNAFVPLFSSKIVSETKEAADDFASQVCMWLFVILLVLTGLMIVCMPQVMRVLAYGFSDNPEKMALTITFGRIVFPYLLLISMVSLFSGMLQSVGKFASAAVTPIILNICMVASIVIGGYYTSIPAHMLCFGVVVAGIIQLSFLWYEVRRAGIHLRFVRPRLNDTIRLLFRRMLPGMIGGGVTQLNLWVNTIVATTLAGAVSYLYYADRVVQFPLALIGTAIGVALLPTLSRSLKAGQTEDAIDIQNRALELALLLTVPAAVGLFLISDGLIEGMFERGKFGMDATVATAAALRIYAIGLPAFVMIKIFLPSYFAAGDTKTPVKIAMGCLALNVLLSVTLKYSLGHIGLAIATSASAWLNTVLLMTGLIRLKRYAIDDALTRAVIKIMAASLAMVVTIVGARHLIMPAFQRSMALDAHHYIFVELGLLVLMGGAVYLCITAATGGLSVMRVLWKRAA